MRLTPLERRISEITDPVVEDLGFVPFAVKMTSDAEQQIVQIMAEDPATQRLGVDDCAKISRAVSAVMDVEDPISGNYRLEVSSPGIDRILISMDHYARYVGLEVKVESDTPDENGQKKFRGTIKSAENDIVTLDTDKGEATVSFPTIMRAKLVLTDELIKATANKEEKE